MTEQELINYQLRLQLEVHALALKATMNLVDKRLCDGQFLPNLERQLRQSAAGLKFPTTSAAMSDLQAAEFQEALQKFLDGLKPGQ